MDVLRNLISGEWQNTPGLVGYRAELLTNMMVERATWDATAPPQQIGDKLIAGSGYIWLRFWLLEQGVVLEKYFDSQRQVIGYHLPICMPVQRRSNQLSALSLYLSLWVTPEGRVTVLHEARFDEAVATGDLAPVETEHAEFQIRELTTALARGTFPPAFVRNFALQ
jgi:predicted RNA-binding protein associated with RNAse of E/G family